MASIAWRVLRTILEEDGSVEHVLRGVLAAFRLAARVARAWPWGHTVTAVFAWNLATRTRDSVNPGVSFAPRTALDFIPGWKSLVNVTVTKVQWP